MTKLFTTNRRESLRKFYAPPNRNHLINSGHARILRSQKITRDIFIPLLYIVGLSGFALVSFLPELLGIGVENSRIITIPYRFIVLIVSFIVILRVLQSRLHSFYGFGYYCFLFFWFIYLIRMSFDVYFLPVESLARNPEIYFLFGIGICMLPAIGFFAIPSQIGLRRALVAISVCMGIVCIIAILGKSTHFDTTRLWGNDVLNPISLGHVGVSLCILSLFTYMTTTSKKSWWRLMLFIITIVIAMYTVIAGGSRGPLLALFLVLPLCVYSTLKGKKSIYKWLLVILLFALITPSLIKNVSDSGGSIIHRVSYLKDREMVSDDIRGILWVMAFNLFIENPLLGSSLDITGFGYPHNMILEAFMATGIVGGLLFLAIIGYGFNKAIRLIKSHNPGAWVGLLFIQYAIGGLLSGTLYDNNGFWYLYAGVVATYRASSGRYFL